MSAYIVDVNHIAYLVQAGTSLALGQRHSPLSWTWDIGRATFSKELNPDDHKQAQRVGQMLWDENVKSVKHHYAGKEPPDSDYPFDPYPERPPSFDKFDPVQVLSSCDCYEYQSCEHDGWPASEAKAYIDALRARAAPPTAAERVAVAKMAFAARLRRCRMGAEKAPGSVSDIVVECHNCNFQGFPSDCHVHDPDGDAELVCPDCGSTKITKAEKVGA